MPVVPEDIRRLFPMLERKVHGHSLVYLDSAATALKPHQVIDAVANFYKYNYSTVHRAVYATAQVATDLYEQSRQEIASFINAASANEIIFTRGATASLNLAAHSLAAILLHEGDEIVITEMEHHSNIVPWQMVRDRYRTNLKIVPVLENGELDMQAYKNMLSSRTKIVAVTHMANTLGTINPIKEMIALAHTVGAVVVIDAAQSIAHMPIDVKDLDADLLAFSGHKLYGPTGVGVLYGKGELLEAMPPYEFGGDMIETVAFERTTFAHPPMKFEAGTPIIAGVIGLGAAIDVLKGIGMESIWAYEEGLYQYLAQKLHAISSITVLGTAPRKGALASFYAKGVHPLDIATMLDLKGIAIRSGHLCAQPVLRRFGVTAAARVSLGCYNTRADIDYFIEELIGVLKILY